MHVGLLKDQGSLFPSSNSSRQATRLPLNQQIVHIDEGEQPSVFLEGLENPRCCKA